MYRITAGLKQIQSGQEGDVFGGIFRQLWHDHAGKALPHKLALDRVIVQKGHCPEVNVNDAFDKADVGGLVIPVGHKNGNVFQAQNHLRVFKERLARIGIFILAANCQDDAAVFHQFEP